MNKELIIKDCLDSVNKIFNNYNDDMIFKRIHQYICNQMPIVINNYSRSLTQQTELSTEHDYFVEFFLEKKINLNNPIWTSDGRKKINKFVKKTKLKYSIVCDNYIINKDLKSKRILEY